MDDLIHLGSLSVERRERPPYAGSGYRNTQAGQAVHFNATVTYDVGKHVYLGANGYFLAQVTDARANRAALPGSREQIAGLGPGMVVQRGSWFYFANAYREFGVKETTSGNRFVIRVTRIF